MKSEDDAPQTAWTVQGNIRRLATFPHGLAWGEPYAAAAKPPKPHEHDWRKNPGKDGKVYNVCKCGACHAHGGRGSVIKGKPPKK